MTPRATIRNSRGEVKKMREGGQVFRSRPLKRRCEKTFLQRIARQSAQSHEVESRYRISLDELESKEKYHSRKPGYFDETPSVKKPDDHPRARDKKKDRPGHNDPVIENGNIPYSFGKTR